jgi:flagellar hook-length control protein FliK
MPGFRSVNLTDFGNTTFSMIKNMPNNTIHSARLVLQPQTLGTVMIEISLANNIAKIDIRVDSREAAKSIESQIAALKDKLSNEGIKTESIDVKLNNFQKETKNNNGQDSGFAKREDADIKREYLSSFGFLKDTPEIEEQEKYKDIRSFFEKSNSFSNYVNQ